MGRLREPFYIAGVKEYLKRLRPYVTVEWHEGLEEKAAPKANREEIRQILVKEAERILRLIGEDELLVILNLDGRQLDSLQMAEQMQKWRQSGITRLNFVIGSAYGLSETIKEKADFRLSFSALTFPHQMAVLILSEQIYRSFKIIRGEPYHH